MQEWGKIMNEFRVIKFKLLKKKLKYRIKGGETWYTGYHFPIDFNIFEYEEC